MRTLTPLRHWMIGSPRPRITNHSPQGFSGEGEVDGLPIKTLAWLFPSLFCLSESVSGRTHIYSRKWNTISWKCWVSFQSLQHGRHAVFWARQIRLRAFPKYASRLYRRAYENCSHVLLVTMSTSWPFPYFPSEFSGGMIHSLSCTWFDRRSGGTVVKVGGILCRVSV